MKTKKLGNSDLHVTELILGTWAIGGTMWSEYDEEGAKEAIKEAINSGINCIDTAPAYGGGHAEELIGDIISGLRDKLIIATKCGLNIEGRYEKILTPEFIMHDLEMSLKRLKTDYVDLYQIHWPVTDVPIEVSMGALMKAKEQGKVRYIGVCNFSGKELEEAINCGEVVSLQPNYSLLEREIESDQMKVCEKSGVSIISYGSLAAGMLTGKYKEHPTFKKGDARNFFYRFFKKEYWPAVKKAVEVVEGIADKHGAKPGHVAIAWILSHTSVAAAIFGARDAAQVRDNLGGASLSLSSDDIEALNEITANIYG
ncbi:MAG TPA: aldo/keto reductase [Spirochaetota bacterium]|nr:aldo/keto reductase [Spirochaetota bacterium]